LFDNILNKCVAWPQKDFIFKIHSKVSLRKGLPAETCRLNTKSLKILLEYSDESIKKWLKKVTKSLKSPNFCMGAYRKFQPST
jgi:hypothetical protein